MKTQQTYHVWMSINTQTYADTNTAALHWTLLTVTIVFPRHQPGLRSTPCYISSTVQQHYETLLPGKQHFHTAQPLFKVCTFPRARLLTHLVLPSLHGCKEIFHFHRSESLRSVFPSAALDSGILLNRKELVYSWPSLSTPPTMTEDARTNYLTGPTTEALSAKSALTLHPGQSSITNPPSSIPGFPLIHRQLSVMLLKYRLKPWFWKDPSSRV